MSEHLASIRWTRNGQPFDYEHYPRDHEVRFERGQRITGSAAPAYFGSAQGVDPEEMLVAALSSCHMLTALAIAAKKGWTVDAYEDDAVGTLGKNDEGRAAVTHVTLRPRIVFADQAPSAEELKKLHESAHRNCFIASSVKTVVAVEPR
ncbi:MULTISPECIES: OsmC family protein [unclassified Lysobacter]|uniref:OsmC family protein n=1 Tax=unclassified Lysobacter TaxID=2635362 RepID=UPI001C23A413|nr:OsmC family protein [Lysobacter sp. MMG2]MBU8975953.1 OsmC family protein [Lysobacter sp. MMG2]